jgi:hypothetical protein
MLGCYILCSEVKVDRLMVEVKVDRHHRQQVEFELDRHQVEGRGSRPGKFEVEDIDAKSTDKRSKCGSETND